MAEPGSGRAASRGRGRHRAVGSRLDEVLLTQRWATYQGTFEVPMSDLEGLALANPCVGHGGLLFIWPNTFLTALIYPRRNFSFNTRRLSCTGHGAALVTALFALVTALYGVLDRGRGAFYTGHSFFS